MIMNFWEICEPFGSDYKHVHVSGRIEHPFRLPATCCDACGQPVSAYFDVVLPYECPPRFRKNRRLTDEDANISMKEFTELAKDLVTEIRKPEGKIHKPSAGAYLQPGFLYVPSIPKADFLWSNLRRGLSSIIVSERVRDALTTLPLQDVAFHRVTLRKIGRRSAKSVPCTPISGEPEDMMDEFRVGSRPSGVSRYYQLLIMAEAKYPPGAEPGRVCDCCGQETRPNWNTKDAAWKKLTTETLVLISKGFCIFRIPERGTVYVNDEFKSAVEQLRATNVEFRAFPTPAKPSPAGKRKRKQRH